MKNCLATCTNAQVSLIFLWAALNTVVWAYHKKCECTVVTGVGHQHCPPPASLSHTETHSDYWSYIKNLPCAESVTIFQDNMFTINVVPDQKTEDHKTVMWGDSTIFGVPEALLSDRGINLLSHLLLQICKSLGITSWTLPLISGVQQHGGMVQLHTSATVLYRIFSTHLGRWPGLFLLFP